MTTSERPDVERYVRCGTCTECKRRRDVLRSTVHSNSGPGWSGEPAPDSCWSAYLTRVTEELARQAGWRE